MNDKVVRWRGLAYAAWGYFFINFNFSIGTINILPRFVGFLFLLCAINSLLHECKDLLLLRSFCIFFAAMNAIDWLMSFDGRTLDGRVVFFDLLVTVAILYFHFQFLTDIAVLAQTCQKDGEKLSVRLRCCRTIYTLLSTAVGNVTAIPTAIWSYFVYQQQIFLLFGLMQGVVAVVIIVTLFQLKKRFQRECEV